MTTENGLGLELQIFPYACMLHMHRWISNISDFNTWRKKSVTREDTRSDKANPLETYKKKPHLYPL